MNDQDLTQMLREIVFHGGKPSRQALAETGVDLEILEQVFDDWRKHRDYLRGYHSLDEIVTKSIYDSYAVAAFEQMGCAEKYRYALALVKGYIVQNVPRGGGSVSPGSYLRVPEEYRTPAEKESPNPNRPRTGRFMIILTRELDWFVYVNFPEYKFIKADGPRDVVEKALGALPENTWYADFSNHIFSSLALEVAKQLLGSLRDSILEKERHIESEKPTLERIELLVNTVATY